MLCLNPEEAKRECTHREQVLKELSAELNLPREREADHPKAACELLASRRYGCYLTTDYTGRPRLDAAKVKEAEKFEGKFVIITNDEHSQPRTSHLVTKVAGWFSLLPAHEADRA